MRQRETLVPSRIHRQLLTAEQSREEALTLLFKFNLTSLYPQSQSQWAYREESNYLT
jgi:hypothetical protein